MGARSFRDLVCWQLAMALSESVVAFTGRLPARTDRKFCEQIRACASSAPANIAEGFARFAPREFARSLVIARGELAETESRLADALLRGYLTDAQHAEAATLAKRAFVATSRLLAAVRRNAGPKP